MIRHVATKERELLYCARIHALVKRWREAAGEDEDCSEK
jgi:hypothetical protein